MISDNQQPVDDDLSKLSDGSESYTGLLQNTPEPDATGNLIGSKDQTGTLSSLGSNLALGMPLKFAGTAVARERELFYGQDEYNRDIEQQKQLRTSLQQTASKVPTDDQHWYSTGASRFVGSLYDPTVIAGGGIAEIGLKAALPSVATMLESEAGTALGARLVKGAIKGTISGALGGAATGAIKAGVEAGSPNQMSLNDYMSNITNWTAMGAAGGVAGPVLNDIWKGVKGKFNPKTLTEDAVSVQNDTPVKDEAVQASADTAIKQASAGKKVNVEVHIMADQNRAIDEVKSKQAAYEQLPDEDKSNIPSPLQQLQDNVDQAKTNLSSSEDNIKGILSNINDEYGELDSDKLKNEALKTPLPRLVESIEKIKATNGLSPETGDNINKLSTTLKSSSYNFGPAQTISDAMKLRSYIVHPDDRKLIESLHDPKNEADIIDQMDKDDYTPENQDVLNNRAAAIRSNDTPVKSMPLYSKHLPAINDALDDFANKKLDVDNAQSNLEYKTAEKNDLTSPINNMADSVINDSDNIGDESATPSIDDITKDDQPYSQATPTIEDMDHQLQQHLDNGRLNTEDFDEINSIDEAEKNDAGQQKFFDMIKTCLLGNGL